jgi:hypothetical protein
MISVGESLLFADSRILLFENLQDIFLGSERAVGIFYWLNKKK